MTNRRFTVLTFTALVLGALFAPVAANAQGTIWDRVRERVRRDQDEDYRRDRRDDDGYYRRGGRISDHERRVLRDVARRLESRSRDLERDVDRLLDNSRIDGTRREDRINNDVRDLRRAAERFQNVAGDSNYLNRSTDEARHLFNEASRVDRLLRRIRLDSRTINTWSQIRNDLRTVSDIYGFRYRDYDDDGFYRRGGRNDDDRRDRRRDNRW